MKNQVMLKDNVIYAKYIGDQTESDIKETEAELVSLIEQVRAGGSVAFLLVDLELMGAQDLNARVAATQSFRTLKVEKVAIINASQFLKHVSNAVAKAAARSHVLRFFDNDKQALEWFNQAMEE